MTKKNFQEALQDSIFETLTKAAKELNVVCYVIGGFVRDYILQLGTAKDIDIVVVGSGIELAQKVAELYLSSKILVLQCSNTKILN